MKYLKISLVTAICTLVLIATHLSARAEKITIQGGVSFFPDPRHAPEVYVEFPFTVHRNQFQFLPGRNPDDPMMAGIYAEVILKDTTGRAIDSAMTRFYTEVDDISGVRDDNVRLFNRLSMMIEPGIYSAHLTVIDIVGKNEGSFLYHRLHIDSIIIDHLNLSSPEVAYRIRVADDSSGQFNSRLVKNNREVIPNPMGVFSAGDTALYVYTELYNLDYSPASEDSFRINYRILTTKGQLQHDYGELILDKPGATAVLTNVLDITDLPAGKFDLELTAFDFISSEADTASRRLIIFPQAVNVGTVVEQIVVHPYDTASIETKSNLVHFFMAPHQLAMLETLNEDGRRRFIDQFFADKDPNPATEENEYLDNVFSRFIYANDNFSTRSDRRDGWRSDRGRVFLQFDVWDDRDEAMAPRMGKPWELWTYQGGVVFVFQDQDGYGDFKLVHSTARGEIYNDLWDSFLKGYDPKIFKEEVILPDVRQ